MFSLRRSKDMRRAGRRAGRCAAYRLNQKCCMSTAVAWLRF
ncbi:hypothetical protein FOCG_02795 [Fusarium oxysporum f. sp. radicis-lycopersici 26381]|uniref:Uncharacterized protein n=1 Tax=Fusarium oxysporum Fo47 TaxID=660027 RepID=W9KC83_FUSOX|nr:hypothetical protein FOZG_07050 [Fusarium oxysporum Fo47]EXA00931.1 hypothetical protein FOWG_00995 [Fusarium oxysporum f. sp. lycopersici MN25]EXL59614.1 hypothetical protein FOCG_02795 [Fusarium oxysporum f. sp. radicis-lycopersici 26381]